MLTIHVTKKQLTIMITAIILAVAIPAIAQYCVQQAPTQVIGPGGVINQRCNAGGCGYMSLTSNLSTNGTMGCISWGGATCPSNVLTCPSGTTPHAISVTTGGGYPSYFAEIAFMCSKDS